MRFIPFILSAAIAAASITTAEAASRIDKLKSTNEIALGYRETVIPFSYLDGQQKPIGYSIDICHSIVDTLKKNLNLPDLHTKMVPVTPASRIPLIANGTVDLVCGVSTNNAQRQTQVSFAPTTFVTATRFAALKKSHLKDLHDFNGKVVVGVSGSSNLRWLTKTNDEQQLGMKIITAKGQPEGLFSVDTGRASAFFMDDVLLAGLVANSHNPNDWMISDTAYTIEPYGIMEPKADEPFKTAVDNAVKAIMANGAINALYNKWFTRPIPPTNVNLNWPISPELKKAFEHPTDSSDPAVYK
jgi:glutamate/aspartate transport system substrate-binding protein